jgi:CBS domain containing-hemolysin-like protein
MIVKFITLGILLALSGFFSSAETALFSISKSKARFLAKGNDRAGALIKAMKADPHRLLSTILIGNNVANVAAASIATSLAIDLVQGYAVGIATGVMTFLILVFGEVLPKSIATRNNVLIARMTIYPIYWISLLCLPILVILNFIPRITGRISKSPKVTEEELMTIVEAVEEEGQIKVEEKELIHNIFEFDDTAASEIMTPRGDMFVVDIKQELDLARILDSGYSRIPVIEGDIDHVIGILNIKDLFLHTLSCDATPDLRSIMRPPYFVPENKKLDSLLQQFKKQRNHIAIVVDEHGGVSGLITLEDALEELVGDITDETDKEEPHIVKLKPKEWRVLGKTGIDEVNARIPINIPDSREYDTFTGFIFDKIGRIPHENEEILIDGFSIMVEEIDGVRIKQYLVRQN